MFGLLNNKPDILLGIDISSTSVKLLELSKSANGFHVESFGVGGIPPEAIVDKVIADQDALGAAIAQVIKSARAKSKYAAVAVADSSVITKVLQMGADLDDMEIENQISFEADKYIPYPLEEVSLDFTTLGESANNPEQADILLVASRSENVQSRADAIEKSGLTVKVVDVESYAMERACALTLPEIDPEAQGQEQIAAIFDIGSEMTNLTVLSSGTTIFSREDVFGGNQLIARIVEQYQLSPEEAFQKMVNNELPDDYEDSVLAPFREEVVVHIRRGLQFFFSASQYSEIHHILLAGGNANLPGIAELIEDQMGVPASIANPFASMSFGSRVNKELLMQYAPSLMICCGLAMRSFE